MILVKLSWIVGFMFTIVVIEGTLPTLWQWGLASIYTLITLPLNYYLTYCFNVKSDDPLDKRIQTLERKQKLDLRELDYLSEVARGHNEDLNYLDLKIDRELEALKTKLESIKPYVINIRTHNDD